MLNYDENHVCEIIKKLVERFDKIKDEGRWKTTKNANDQTISYTNEIDSVDAEIYCDYCEILYENDHHDSISEHEYEWYCDCCHIVERSIQF